MAIYKSHVDRFEDTRNLQWKFNVAAWTLLSAAIYFKGTSDICIPTWTVYVASGTLLVGHLMFAILTQISLNSSKAICHGILKKMNDYATSNDIDVNVKKLGEDRKWKKKDNLWVFLQLLFTVFLIMIFIWTTKL